MCRRGLGRGQQGRKSAGDDDTFEPRQLPASTVPRSRSAAFVWCSVSAGDGRLERCALHPGPFHSGAQRRVVSEAAGLLGGREVVCDEQAVGVIGKPHDAFAGAAVLDAQWLEFVVHRPPGVVVADVVLDGECGAHGVPPPCAGGSLPPAGNVPSAGQRPSAGASGS
jgi:hypothetical protein